MKTIAERISEGLKMRHMKQTELAERSGIGKGAISCYISGAYEPKQKNIYRIAKALNVSEAWLMGHDVSPERKEDAGPNSFPYEPKHKIPVLGRVAAGLPLYAEENIEGYILTELNGGAEYFGLRIVGDSMNAARIQDGDIVVVRKQDVVENGEIAIVLVGNSDATVKKFMRTGNIVHLIPLSTNPAHEVQEYDLRDTSVKILGKVVRVQFDM